MENGHRLHARVRLIVGVVIKAVNGYFTLQQAMNWANTNRRPIEVVNRTCGMGIAE
jgi:hypothetical protein